VSHALHGCPRQPCLAPCGWERAGGQGVLGYSPPNPEQQGGDITAGSTAPTRI